MASHSLVVQEIVNESGLNRVTRISVTHPLHALLVLLQLISDLVSAGEKRELMVAIQTVIGYRRLSLPVYQVFLLRSSTVLKTTPLKTHVKRSYCSDFIIMLVEKYGPTSLVGKSRNISQVSSFLIKLCKKVGHFMRLECL